MLMKILIVDGQGGGVGRALVEAISAKCRDAEIIAVGTNSMATANMLKGKMYPIHKINGATGENAVLYNSQNADVIVGPIGIVMVNAMYGEITPKMAEAISGSRARIILIPMNRCQTCVVGVQDKKIAEYIEEVVTEILSIGCS